jgi:hypothetical protein
LVGRDRGGPVAEVQDGVEGDLSLISHTVDSTTSDLFVFFFWFLNKKKQFSML